MQALKFLPPNVKLDQTQARVLGSLEQILLTEPRGRFLGIFKDNNIKNGIYLQGSVGSGKTMLMEACYEIITKRKSLLHYQDFIQKLHKDIHETRMQDRGQILKNVAKHYIANFDYLFLDEFEVKDITDAMIIGPLFREFIKNRLFIFITTNNMPDELYKDGLQRESFLPFIIMIKKEFALVSLNSTHDYRMEKSVLRQERIFYPINKINQQKIEKIINNLTNNQFSLCEIKVFGRKISFKNAHKKILVTDFEELFVQDFSYIDYIHICKNFKTIIIKQVKNIEPDNTNLAIRFINFIDNAYFYKTFIFMNLQSTPNKLYENGIRMHEFKRTISRLHEMSNE